MPTNFFQQHISALALLVIAYCAMTSQVIAQIESPTAANESAAVSEATKDAAAKADASQSDEANLYFTFERTPWRDVIKWLAGSAELALHVSDLPQGSFTYSDPKAYTVREAMSRVNLFLLPEGYTLVQSGKLLSVINLSDPRSLKQLDVLAELADLDDLDQYESYDVVKCFFSLGELNAEAAVDELGGLNLMTTPKVFERTNRLMITETAGKLKSVKNILDAFRPELSNGTVVKSFTLDHVDAEDVLEVARPHLGLATGETIGLDISLSSDLQGRNIFVTGVEEKVRLIEGLIESIDKPEVSGEASATATLKSHPVTGGNARAVYDVLQTILAQKSVRLSMDDKADSIVALAEADVHREIEQTIQQLQASDAEFAVIPLRTVDPYFAIGLIEEMLDIEGMKDKADGDDIPWWERGRRDNKKEDVDVPRIDADVGNRRLFVRAKKSQLEQIREIIAGIDGGKELEGREAAFRVIPLKGNNAERILETAGRFWRGENPVVLYPSAMDEVEQPAERIVHADATASTQNTPPLRKPVRAQNVRFLSDNLRSKAPAIRCQLTPRGVLIQCEATEALDDFEDHVQTISGPFEFQAAPPTVFYLKFTKPEPALRMLAELLDGGEAAKEGETGTLVNGVSDSLSDSFSISLFSTANGTPTLINDSITVVGDARLNRLIAQGTAADIEKIESYLRIIDKDTGITDVVTYGTSHVIELRHGNANEVATLLREAYGSRISGGQTAPTGGQPGGNPRPDQREKNDDKGENSKSKKDSKNAAPGRGGTKAPETEPRMTIAVHELSNSLVVTAPDALFKEVEALARTIDLRSQQTVKIIERPNTAELESQLLRVFGDRLQMSTLSGTTSAGAVSKKSSKSKSAPAPKGK